MIRSAGMTASTTIAVREHQPVAAVGELAGQEAVAGDDRATGGGSRRRRCWRPGSGWRTSRTAGCSRGRAARRRPCRPRIEQQRSRPRRPWAGGGGRAADRPKKRVPRMSAIDDEGAWRRSCDSGFWKAGTPSEMASTPGQGDGSRREGAQQHQHAEPGEPAALAGQLVAGGRRWAGSGRGRRCRAVEADARSWRTAITT